MKYLKVRNVSRRVDLGQKVRVATSLLDRAVGLLATSPLRAGEGLWISPCKSIHTFFMRYPIDVLFLDSAGVVLSQKSLRPWRISAWHSRSRGVLEMAAGTLKHSGTQVGNQIEMKELN